MIDRNENPPAEPIFRVITMLCDESGRERSSIFRLCGCDVFKFNAGKAAMYSNSNSDRRINLQTTTNTLAQLEYFSLSPLWYLRNGY